MAGMRKLSTGEMVLCASGAGALGGLAGNPAGESTFLCPWTQRAQANGRYHSRSNGCGSYESGREATWIQKCSSWSIQDGPTGRALVASKGFAA
jgi:hypothetical protein